MTSITRQYSEPRSLRRTFTIQAYATPNINVTDTYIYSYFTVNNNSLFRIESDLSGVIWVIARDMGTQRTVDTIDSDLVSYIQNTSGWSNIRVIHSGIARKFQVVSIPYGSDYAGYIDPGVGIPMPQYNDGVYETSLTQQSPIYSGTYDAINQMLIVGRSETTVFTSESQNLPYGTFWAITHPLIIEYTVGGNKYTRAIKHKINEVTLF